MSLHNLRKAITTINNLQSLGGLLKPDALDRLNEAEIHLSSILDMVYHDAPRYYSYNKDRGLTQNQN